MTTDVEVRVVPEIMYVSIALGTRTLITPSQFGHLLGDGHNWLYRLPHVEVDTAYVADNTTIAVPTLKWVFVPRALRRTAIGSLLIRTLLQWMRETEVRILVFENYANDFWTAMAIRHAENVRLDGTVGTITID